MLIVFHTVERIPSATSIMVRRDLACPPYSTTPNTYFGKNAYLIINTKNSDLIQNQITPSTLNLFIFNKRDLSTGSLALLTSKIIIILSFQLYFDKHSAISNYYTDIELHLRKRFPVDMMCFSSKYDGACLTTTLHTDR